MNIKLLAIIFIILSSINMFFFKKLKTQSHNINKPLFYYLSKQQLKDLFLLKKKLNKPKQKIQVSQEPNQEDNIPEVEIPIFSYTDNHIPIYKN